MRRAALALAVLLAGCADVAAPPAAPAAPAVAAPLPRAPVRAKAAAPVRGAQQALPRGPTLDIAALTARLRATSAIGVFTKLALKNQLDDLLQLVRARHEGGGGVAALRQPYDMLVLKVLAVLQDGDPSLARSISGSREALWEILADPVKFNAIA